MLTIEQYGIKLTRLQESEIELVRSWRNKPHVRKNMLYQKEISEEEQKEWFKSINNKYNYYFIIHYNQQKVGVINVKDFNPQNGFGEGGIFIGESDLIDSFIPALSSLCLINFIFFELKISNFSRIKVLKNNLNVIHYNQSIGYKYFEQYDELSDVYQMTKKDYIACSSELQTIAKKMNNGNDALTYSGEVSDNQIAEINALFSAESIQ